MADPPLKIEGSNLGILVGYTGNSGVFLYVLHDDSVPYFDMTNEELTKCLGRVQRFLTIPFEAVRQVYVNKKPVWRNRDSFDLASMNIDPYRQTYWGRGEVKVEFRDDVEGISELVDRILDRDVGLQKV